MHALVEHAPDAVARHDLATRIVYVNPAWTRLTGSAGDVAGRRVDDLAPGLPAMALYQRALDHAAATGEPAEFDFIGDAGGRPAARIRIVPEAADDGSLIGLMAFGRDLARQRELEDELSRRTLEFRDLVEHSPDNIARYDSDCRRVYANARMIAALGGDAAQVVGKTPVESPGGPRASMVMQVLRDVLERGEVREVEMRWQAAGEEVCDQVRMSPLFDSAGRVTHVLAVGRDVTEIDRYRRQVHHQAFYDRLTGLPNRLLLCDRISQAIADAQYHGHQFAVLLLDLDHFKNVNDSLGHTMGDRLLCAAARRVQDCVRTHDTVARLGGDEFAILLPDVRSADEVATVADKMLRHLAKPFLVDGRELFVTGSIGIALFPGDGVEVDALFRFADSAMYHGKNAGRNNFQFYARDFTVRSLERMDTELALRKALKNGELEVYYQPQIDLQTGLLIGAEALLRWRRAGRGLVGPDEFIAIAEESGLIVEIGEWVLSVACQAVVRWNERRSRPLKVAVNLSPRQFVRNELVDTVSRILADTGCKPTWLDLEITESLLLEHSERTVSMLAALDAMGASISIDDFGTGYSALSYLHRFPVSHLKIDRAFVDGIEAQPDKGELVKAMLSIAAALNLGSVAEGVETAQQAAYLRLRGCRAAQGYLFGRPMPVADFENLLNKQNALPTP
jgi:diguanylate cyclase (GGDEF)-like protein/PAS domain S-box-containing protein